MWIGFTNIRVFLYIYLTVYDFMVSIRYVYMKDEMVTVMMRYSFMKNLIMTLSLILFSHLANAFVIDFDSDDFVTTPVFNQVVDFDFRIEIEGALESRVYETIVSDDDTQLVEEILYNISGVLTIPTPSEFLAFDLMHPPITGEAFDDQVGSALRFEVSQDADLSDGLQLNELIPDTDGVIFILNAREVGTGRFHPPVIQLRSDGTGIIQNSNNQPDIAEASINPGAEYITNLSFNLEDVTLVRPRNSSGSQGFWVLFFLSLLLLRRCFFNKK